MQTASRSCKANLLRLWMPLLERCSLTGSLNLLATFDNKDGASFHDNTSRVLVLWDSPS